MAQTFHWAEVMTICHATEREDLLLDAMERLVGEGNVTLKESDGHFGNRIAVMSARMTKDREAKYLFSVLGPEMLSHLRESLDDRIDEGCTFHLRLDKQRAVQEVYAVSHGGDVISITAKVASHPARKAKAVDAMDAFLSEVILNPLYRAPAPQ